MSPENEKYMCETYPSLYDMSKPPTQSLMCFGFPDDGWFELLKELSDKIVTTGIAVRAVQVKEKFGTLRYYVDYPNATSNESYRIIEDLIRQAEQKSGETCEVCGKPGEERNEGWIKTLCDECNTAREEMRAKRGW